MFGMLAQQLGPLAVGPRKCDARQPNRASDAWIEDIQHASSMSMSGARIILLQKAFASRGDAIGLLILGSFLVVLSIPILRDLNSLPTNFNVDAYQHLSFAYTFYDAVRHHGELPLWNPYFGGGIPWAGYIYNLGLSPWALIYALAGEIAGVKIALVLSLALGGIAVYGVARKVALLSPGFSLFAALLFLSSSWMAGRVQGGNYNEFSTHFWLFAVLCFHELLRGRLLGLLFPLYFVVALNPAKYTAVTVFLAGLVIVLCSPVYKDERRFAVLIWLAGALIGLLLAMPKILPMINYFGSISSMCTPLKLLRAIPLKKF